MTYLERIEKAVEEGDEEELRKLVTSLLVYRVRQSPEFKMWEERCIDRLLNGTDENPTTKGILNDSIDNRASVNDRL